MADEENVGGGMNEIEDDGSQQSAQRQGGQGSEGAMSDQAEGQSEGQGEDGQGQSNVGDWDPAQQGGGGELY
jgi:hypothetical protein